MSKNKSNLKWWLCISIYIMSDYLQNLCLTTYLGDFFKSYLLLEWLAVESMFFLHIKLNTTHKVGAP